MLLIPAEKVTKPAADKKPVETKDAPKSDVKVEEKPVEVKAAVEPAKVEEKPAEAAPVVAPVKVEEKPVEEKPVVDAEPAVTTPPPAVEDAGNTYVVKDGDDLVSVSIACGVSPSQLMDLNGLKAGDGIKPGQVLKLPAHATKPQGDK